MEFSEDNLTITANAIKEMKEPSKTLSFIIKRGTLKGAYMHKSLIIILVLVMCVSLSFTVMAQNSGSGNSNVDLFPKGAIDKANENSTGPFSKPKDYEKPWKDNTYDRIQKGIKDSPVKPYIAPDGSPGVSVDGEF